jgi:shikimate kinase
LRASILTNPAVFGDATMTVTQGALFIGLGTGNVISNLDPQTYKKDWVVYVTDSNGVAVANKDLTIKVLPVEYRKGHLVFNTVWTYDLATLQTCANEDTDYTATVVSRAKDFNGDGSCSQAMSSSSRRRRRRLRPRAESPNGFDRPGDDHPSLRRELLTLGEGPPHGASNGIGNRVVERAGVLCRSAGLRLHQRDQSAGRGGQPVRRQPLQRAELIGCRDRQPGRTSGRRQEHGRSAAGEAPERPVHRLRFVLERRIGESIATFFEREGEAAFRDAEQDLLREVVEGSAAHGAVIATGGGSSFARRIVDLLRDLTICIWLDAKPETLLERLGGTIADRCFGWPIRKRASSSWRTSEKPWYAEAATLKVSASRDAGSTLSAIKRALDARTASAVKTP